jgi:D-aminopeptidase
VLLLGNAVGSDEELEAIHGPRLERLMEHLVETPVRGVVYEGTREGEAVVQAAAKTWRIPVALVAAEDDLAAAVQGALTGPRT